MFSWAKLIPPMALATLLVLLVACQAGPSPTPSALPISQASPPGPTLATGVISGVDNTRWTTVTLGNTFDSMVVVATPNYSLPSPPLVVRVQNASGNSFQVRVDRTDGRDGAVAGVDVYYTVVEEGVYNVADHGVKMEAVNFNSTVTDGPGSWASQARSYSNSYTDPVVVGQVMTYNDPNFSAFWSRGATPLDPPSAGALFVGKHVGEDPVTTRADETIGYIVIEEGSGTVGSLNYVAALGTKSIEGLDGSPPYTYAFSGLGSVASAVLSQAGMDGGNGGWAILYGPSPVTTGVLNLAIEEDQTGDSERSHIFEQVAFIVFGSGPTGSALTPQVIDIELLDAPQIFDPSNLVLDAGVSYRFRLQGGLTFHTFTIPELGIHYEVEPRQVVEFTFTPSKAGPFRLICVPHEFAGMVGEVTVLGGKASSDLPPPVDDTVKTGSVIVRVDKIGGFGQVKPATGLNVVPPSLKMFGWALDKESDTGTGVDRVEVWLGPRPTGRLLTVADYGRESGYLVELYGAEFARAGWRADITDLPRGKHELYVYARGSRDGLYSPPANIIMEVDPELRPDMTGDLVVAADFPADFVLAPDGKLLYGELQTGAIRVVVNGRLEEAVWAKFEVTTKGASGLTGIALDPAYARNGFVYVMYTVPHPGSNTPMEQRVVRLRDMGLQGAEPTTLVVLPATVNINHNGGRLAFGPDGKLYVSVGDTDRPTQVQDPGTLIGKILRFNADGTVPADNPIPGSPVFALGLRNVFGMAFHPLTGSLYVTENGPKTDDELNIIVAGGNYGWPLATGQEGSPEYAESILTWTPTVGLTGLAFHPTDPSVLYVCSWVRNLLEKVTLTGESFENAEQVELVARGCALQVRVGPDGMLYYSDRLAILRMIPP